MNVSHALTFVWSPWSLAGSVIAVLVAMGLSYWSWRRSGYQFAQGFLETLRLVIILLCTVMFNQPEWISEYQPEDIPTVAVLLDVSNSMDTRDVLPATGSTSTPITRRDAISPMSKAEMWTPLNDKFNIAVEPLALPDANRGTNIHDPLLETSEKLRNLRAIVLASDGDWNEGPPPVQAATQLRQKDIPVFVVPVGNPRRMPDIELLSLDAPTFGIAGKSVRIPFTIDSSMPRDYVTTVTLKTSDGEAISQEIKIAPMGRTTDAIYWKPKSTGDFTVTLSIPKHGEELIPENNQLTTPVSIREEKLEVLVVDSYPRWEYRYLRNALSRDPGVNVSCLLFHPGLGHVGGGNQDYIKQFPAGLEELSKYDVVFLGDVGVDNGQLTPEQCRLIKGLVEHQASGLVFIPGMYGYQQSLFDTELSELYPVVPDEAQPGGWGSRAPGHFELTEQGRRSLLTKLADTQEENLEVWENLPGFQWYAGVLRAKAGSEVLAVHKDVSNDSGRLPLLVTRTYGSGKVLFMGTDGAWRWRKGVEDKYHYRLWGQVVRWMAYQRNMAKGETMRLYFSPDQPQVRQTLSLHAQVADRGGEPLSQGDVMAKITAPNGESDTVRLISGGEEWGVFHGQYTTHEPGKHEVVLTCKQTGATLETSFYVQGVAAERVGRAARPEVLEEIARVTRGKVLSPNELEEVIGSLSDLPAPSPAVRRVQLWCHPVFAGVIIGLLGIFWIARKAVGLI